MRKRAGRLTQPSLVNLFRREGKHSQQLDKYFNYRLRHRRSGLDRRINLKSTQEVFYAFEDVGQGIVACGHVLGRLAEADIVTSRLERVREE